MQYYNLTSIILKREDHKENDLLITVYSKEKGKLKLFLKSAKKITSKLSGHVEPVSLVKLDVIGRRASQDQVIGAQLTKSYMGIKADLNRLSYAGYLLELTDTLTKEENDDENIFELLHKALGRINETKEIKLLPIIRLVFVYKLLNMLGYRPRAKDLKLTESVEFILNHGLDEIKNNELVLTQQKKLFDLAQSTLEQQLDKPIRSEELLSKK